MSTPFRLPNSEKLAANTLRIRSRSDREPEIKELGYWGRLALAIVVTATLEVGGWFIFKNHSEPAERPSLTQPSAIPSPETTIAPAQSSTHPAQE